MLAAHAVELFLKGALLKRNPGLDVWNHGHNIDTLQDEYRSNFKESVFEWEIPFSQLTVDEWVAMKAGWKPLTDEQIKEARARQKMPTPSILYRYPVDRGGKEWTGLYGFVTPSFLKLLDQLGKDFDRIKSHLAQ